MENAGQENCRWLLPGDKLPVVWQRGEGPRVIVEYLFPEIIMPKLIQFNDCEKAAA